MNNQITLSRSLIVLILLMISSVVFGQFPSSFTAVPLNNSHNLYFNNKTLLGTGNAAVGCHLLDNQAKCFTINIIEQNGAMSCATALFDKDTGRAIKPWTKLLCGVFSFKELLEDSRTAVKSYDPYLLPEEELQALTAYYPKIKRISFNLNQAGPAVVYVYGTLKTSDSMFQNTVRGVDNIIRSIKNPDLLKLLDGQRFVLINSGDTPSQMPGLFDLNLPTWIDTETRGASIFDISTTIISEEMNCKQNPTTYTTPNTQSKTKGPEQLVYFVAQTISDAFRMKSHIAQAVANGSFNKLPFIDELRNNQADIFPIITQAWFNANYTNPGPKTRSQLLSYYPNVYNYTALFFNPQVKAVNICPVPALAREPINNVVYNQTTVNNYTYRSYNPEFGFHRYSEFRDYYRSPSFIIFYSYNNQRYFDRHPNYRWNIFGRSWRDRSGNWDWSYRDRPRTRGSVTNVNNINNVNNNNNNVTVVVNPTTGTASTVPLSSTTPATTPASSATPSSTSTDSSSTSSSTPGTTAPATTPEDAPTTPLPPVEATPSTPDNSSTDNNLTTPEPTNEATPAAPSTPGTSGPTVTTTPGTASTVPVTPEPDASIALPAMETAPVTNAPITSEPSTSLPAADAIYPPATSELQTAPVEPLPALPANGSFVMPEPSTAPIVQEPQAQIPEAQIPNTVIPPAAVPPAPIEAPPSVNEPSISAPQSAPVIVEPSPATVIEQNTTSSPSASDEQEQKSGN